MEEIKPDNVNHPAHYEVGGYECEKVMEAIFGKAEVAVWSKLNAFKYLCLCKAVKNIFHDSYEYTRQYREFRKEMENK